MLGVMAAVVGAAAVATPLKPHLIFVMADGAGPPSEHSPQS